MEQTPFDLTTATIAELNEELARLERRRMWVLANPQLGLGADLDKHVDVLKAIVAKQTLDLLTLSGDGESLEDQRTRIHADALAEVASKLSEAAAEVERQTGLTKLARADLQRERRAMDLVASERARAVDQVVERDNRIAKLEGELEMANATIGALRKDHENLSKELEEATAPAGGPELPDPTASESAGDVGSWPKGDSQ